METVVVVGLISSGAGLLGVALGSVVQPWLNARFERRRFSWEQRRALLPQLHKLHERASYVDVDWADFSHAYLDFGTEVSVWLPDRLLQIYHNWMTELIENQSYDRERIRDLLLAMEVVLSACLAVEAGTRWRLAFAGKRRQMKKHLMQQIQKPLEERTLPEEYIW